MRILYTLNSGNPGGMEQHVCDLVSQMVLRNHEVYVWCQNGVICDWYKKAGAKVLEKTIKKDIDLGYIKDLRKFLVTNRIQVVHAHELKAVANSLVAGFLARVNTRITHIHTPFSNWQVPRSKRTVYNFFYALAIRLLGTKEIALTESIKKTKIRSGIPAKKISVIPNGLDVSKFYTTETERVNFRKEICRKHNIDRSAKIIGNLSRTTKEKGHDILIKAFAKLINDGVVDRQDLVLMICGGGELEESLWNLAGSLGVKDRLVITGRFDDDLKLKYYTSFDYFVFPTLAEGFGIVLIEALVVGLPVVCSNLEVLQEVGGNLPKYFETGDCLDLSEKIGHMLKGKYSDENKLAQRNHVESKYSLAKFGESYEALYECTLSCPL